MAAVLIQALTKSHLSVINGRIVRIWKIYPSLCVLDVMQGNGHTAT